MLSGGDSSGFDTPDIFPAQQNCVYTACYCEENVWKLCDHVREHHPQELKNCNAVFISNKNKQIPLWHQRASEREDRLVIWDYHVMVLYCSRDGTLVYDLDTELPFPCHFLQYMMKAVQDDNHFKEELRRQFRVIQGEEFLATFASDRSHMLKEDGTWLAEPPSYPCISTAGSTNNINDFISMEKNVGFGKIYSTSEFLQAFL